MSIETIARIQNINPTRAAQMAVTLEWVAAHFDFTVLDRKTKNGKGGRVAWMRKPAGYPANGLPWHDVRGRYVYPASR